MRGCKGLDLARKLAEELWRRGEMLERLAPGVVGEVTQYNVDEVVNSNRVAFLYFTAEWCGPCIAFYQTFRELASIYAAPGVYFGKVDVDRSYPVAERFGVRNIPSIVVILGSRVVDVIVGQQPRERLEEKIRSYIAASAAGP